MTSPPTKPSQVLIAGGGPVGIGLAIELALRGVRSTVIERHARIPPIPKGQNLTQRTMEHFRAWGVEHAIRDASPIPVSFGIGGLTAYGTLLSDWHYMRQHPAAAVRHRSGPARARCPVARDHAPHRLDSARPRAARGWRQGRHRIG
jgi:hypothetical protein